MDKANWYFGQVADEADLDSVFSNVEAAINLVRKDSRAPGVLWGCQITPNGSDVNSFLISTGVVQGPSGERIFVRDFPGFVGGYYDVDTAGLSTDPGTGNCRWVTICARFGRQMSAPVTDDTANTVYTSLRDSWNANGLNNATDATKTANDAYDGGAQTDASGESFDAFYIVAGPTIGIGSTPNYPSVPADAVILADILYSDGDQGATLLDDAISIARRATPYATDGGRAKDDASMTPERRMLYAMQGAAGIFTRFFTCDAGLEITVNASWNPVYGIWSCDNLISFATRIRVSPSGLTIDQMRSGDFSGPGNWLDTVGASGWVNSMNIGDNTNTAGEIGTLDLNGNASGNGVQSGYVSWGGVVSGSPSNPIGYAAIQFARKFTSTPSSVTLGSAGPNETNVSSVATGNLKTTGCDFLVSATTNAKTVAQRTYTATQ